jgi:hypothetical protein
MPLGTISLLGGIGSILGDYNYHSILCGGITLFGGLLCAGILRVGAKVFQFIVLRSYEYHIFSHHL